MKGTTPKSPLREPLSMQHCGAARKGPWRVSRMAVAVASVLSAQAQAQPADKTIEEVVVTGSRIARTGFDFDCKAKLDEFFHHFGHRGNALLARRNFFRYAYDLRHEFPLNIAS